MCAGCIIVHTWVLARVQHYRGTCVDRINTVGCDEGRPAIQPPPSFTSTALRSTTIPAYWHNSASTPTIRNPPSRKFERCGARAASTALWSSIPLRQPPSEQKRVAAWPTLCKPQSTATQRRLTSLLCRVRSRCLPATCSRLASKISPRCRQSESHTEERDKCQRLLGQWEERL